MIFKPSETTPLTAFKLAEIYTEAGVPDGVFNVVQGAGREIGQWLTEHPVIEKSHSLVVWKLAKSHGNCCWLYAKRSDHGTRW